MGFKHGVSLFHNLNQDIILSLLIIVTQTLIRYDIISDLISGVCQKQSILLVTKQIDKCMTETAELNDR